MSVEQAKAFIERMKSDEAFREKVMAIEDAAGRLACIQGEGFDCEAEEINEAVGALAGTDRIIGGDLPSGVTPYIKRTGSTMV